LVESGDKNALWLSLPRMRGAAATRRPHLLALTTPAAWEGGVFACRDHTAVAYTSAPPQTHLVPNPDDSVAERLDVLHHMPIAPFSSDCCTTHTTKRANNNKMSGEWGVPTPSCKCSVLPANQESFTQADHVAAAEAPTTKPSTAAADEAAQTTSQASRLLLVRRNLQGLAIGITFSVTSRASTGSSTVRFAFSLRC